MKNLFKFLKVDHLLLLWKENIGILEVEYLEKGKT